MAVREIRCPECSSHRAVEKIDFGQYRCGACGETFTKQDLVPS